ncbi:hypothetical protein F5B17DRAFT_160941 [Nemania serpens]|nr:hypothetical protein F5B17DRAFT_160941 [Nemania serpens]
MHGWTAQIFLCPCALAVSVSWGVFLALGGREASAVLRRRAATSSPLNSGVIPCTPMPRDNIMTDNRTIERAVCVHFPIVRAKTEVHLTRRTSNVDSRIDVETLGEW